MKSLKYGVAVFLLMIGCSYSEAQTKTDYIQQAQEVVKRMTLAQKISQLHGTKDKNTYRIVIGIKSLNIPDLPLCNGPAGLGPAGKGHESRATALPAPISLAATWDTAAAWQYGMVAGKESLGTGNILLEAPDVNIARIPYNGRTFEGYGEDPFLCGKIAAANIQGIQHEGIMANVKHYAANNQENGRGSINVVVDERTLREIYLPAFETAVKEGEVASIMAAYNKVNGAHCTENDILLNQILKKEWNFKGFVTSDFGAVHSTVPCAKYGLDLELPSGIYFSDALLKAVEDKEISEEQIDEKLIRRFSTMMQYNLWNTKPKRMPIPAEHANIAKKLSEGGMVLLKNDSKLLPINTKKMRSIALIGPYSHNAMTGGGGSSFVEPIFRISPVDGMKLLFGKGMQIYQYDGASTDSAMTIAKKADAVILMLGDNQTEGRDHSISLGEKQNKLASQILQAVPNTVVVLKTGGPVLMPWIDNCHALLEAWYPGEEDGLAVAEVLFGKANPSGKLPITFPKTDNDTPIKSAAQYPGENGNVTYSEGLFVGYRWYDKMNIEPLFPFGYGLSYTNFKLSNIKMRKTDEGAEIQLKVKNTGKRSGSEVVQVYVSLPEEVKDAPQQLKGFEKVVLKASESKVVTIVLNKRAFSYWDTQIHGWKIPAGKVKIAVGNSSRNIIWSDYLLM